MSACPPEPARGMYRTVAARGIALALALVGLTSTVRADPFTAILDPNDPNDRHRIYDPNDPPITDPSEQGATSVTVPVDYCPHGAASIGVSIVWRTDAPERTEITLSHAGATSTLYAMHTVLDDPFAYEGFAGAPPARRQLLLAAGGYGWLSARAPPATVYLRKPAVVASFFFGDEYAPLNGFFPADGGVAYARPVEPLSPLTAADPSGEWVLGVSQEVYVCSQSAATCTPPPSVNYVERWELVIDCADAPAPPGATPAPIQMVEIQCTVTLTDLTTVAEFDEGAFINALSSTTGAPPEAFTIGSVVPGSVVVEYFVDIPGTASDGDDFVTALTSAAANGVLSSALQSNGIPAGDVDVGSTAVAEYTATPSPEPPAGDGDGAQSEATGDPHMVGFKGQRFDYHGAPGEFFNLVSTPETQLNAFLQPELLDGLTYMGSIGLALLDGSKVQVTAVPSDDDEERGSLMVEMNELVVDSSTTTKDLSVEILDAYSVKITCPELIITASLHKEEFIDLKAVELRVVPAAIHGVLGNTANLTMDKEMEGEDSDYFVKHMWSADFRHNLFKSPAQQKRTVAKKLGPITASENKMALTDILVARVENIERER